MNDLYASRGEAVLASLADHSLGALIILYLASRLVDGLIVAGSSPGLISPQRAGH